MNFLALPVTEIFDLNGKPKMAFFFFLFLIIRDCNYVAISIDFAQKFNIF